MATNIIASHGHLKHEELMRDRNAKGQFIGDKQHRGVFGMSPMSYNRGAGIRDIENRLGEQLDFEELLVGQFASRTAPGLPVLWLFHDGMNLSLRPLDLVHSGQAEISYRGGSSEILYPRAFPKADLKLTLGGHIIHKDILLKRGHQKTFQFRLDGVRGDYRVRCLDSVA